MNVSKYEAFLSTAAHRSLTAAAEELGYTQSGVSHMLSSLEDEWGVTLLQRSRGGVGLTSDGAELLPYVQAVCDRERMLRNKVHDIRGLMSGTLRVGTFTSVAVQWIPGILHAFRQEYPAIRVELFHGNDDQIQAWMAAGSIDCAFVEIPTAEPFTVTYLARDRVLAIVPEGHPLADKPRLTREDLQPYPFIWEMENDTQVEAWAKKYIPHVKAATTTTDDYAIMAMVENGLGVSILPELVMQHTDRRIVKKELDPLAYRDLGIAVNVGQKPSAAAEAFIRHAVAFVTAP